MSKLLRRKTSQKATSVPLFGHTGFVESLLVRAGGLLVSVDSRGEILIWDTEARRPRQRFSISSSSVEGTASVPGSEDIVVWGWDGDLVRLSVPDLTGIVRTAVHDDRIIDATMGFCGKRKVAATGSIDNTGAIVDLDSGAIVCRSGAHGFWVIAAYPLDDEWATVSRDGTIRFWDLDGQELETFSLPGGHFVSAAHHAGFIVAASIDGTLVVVDIEEKSSKILDDYPETEPSIVDFDGTVVIVGDSTGAVHAIDHERGRLGRVDVHEGGVLGGIATPQFIVTWGLDRLVAVIDRSTWKIDRRIDAHDNLVGCAGMLERELLVTGSADHSIRIHDLSQPADAPGRRHRAFVKGLDFIDEALFSWGHDDSVALRWDPETGLVDGSWRGHYDEVSRLRKLGDELWLSASHDGSLLVRDAFDAVDSRRFGNARGVTSGAATGDSSLALGMTTGDIVHFDVVSGELWRKSSEFTIYRVEFDAVLGWIGALDRQRANFYDLTGSLVGSHECQTFAFAWGRAWTFGTGEAVEIGPDGTNSRVHRLPVGDIEHAIVAADRVVVVDASGKCVAFDEDVAISWSKTWKEQPAARIASDGDLVAIGWHNGASVVVDARSGEVIAREEDKDDEFVVDIRVSESRRQWAIASWEEVRVHDLDSDETWRLGGLERRPDSVWFVGVTVWVAGLGGATWVWEPRSDDLTRLPRHDRLIKGLERMGDGRFVTWGNDGRVVVDGSDGTREREWGGHGSFVYDAGLDAAGRLISWSFDGTARVWDLDTGADVEVLRTRTGGIESGAVAANGEAIWLGTSAGELYCWIPGQERVTLYEAEGWHRAGVFAIERSGEYVASACRGGRLGVWDAASGINIAFWDVAESRGFESLAGTRDGAMIAAGGKSGRIVAIDPVTGTIVFDISAHGAAVRGLAFAPDDELLFSVSADGTLGAWDFDGALVARASLEAEGHAVAASGGGLVAVGDSGGHVHFFDFAREVH